MRRKQLGAIGEQLAAAYLERLGYRVVARNWRCAGGELDLVADDDGTLVFVEVRTRRGAPGAAVESVGPAKQARLAGLAYAYLEELGTSAESPWRIDVIAVEFDAAGRVAHIHHIRDAIEARSG